MKMAGIFSGKRRGLFAQLIANALAQAGLLFVNAMLIRYAFDHFLVSASGRGPLVLPLGLAMVAGALASGLLQRSERIIAEKLGQSYIHHLRLRLFRHVTRMEPRHLQKKRRGAVMLKFIGDLGAIRRWVSLGLVRLVVSSAIIASLVAILTLIDILLAGAIVVLIGAGIMINMRIGASLRQAVLESRRRRSRLSANINEKLARMAVVQVFGRTDREVRRVRRQSRNLLKALVERAQKIGAIRGVVQGGTALAGAVVLLIGIHQVAAGQTTAGTVAAAMVVVGFLSPSLKRLGRVYEYYQEAQVAEQKINQFLGGAAPIRPGAGRKRLAAGPGQVKLVKVSVSGALKKVSAVAAPGQVVAVVGPNGAGKSTLLGLMARLVAPERGKILIDGQNIARINLASLRQAVGIVSPDLPLLAGSLAMNLRYRCPGCSEDELAQVKRLCGIDQITRALPKGEGFRVHEGGRNLSAGQRQRIMLARALLGTPRLLLLDEVDAHMDDKARKILDEVLRTYPGTILWATHQKGPLPGVDVVWKLNKKRLSTAAAASGQAVKLRAAG